LLHFNLGDVCNERGEEEREGQKKEKGRGGKKEGGITDSLLLLHLGDV
jgi:hypothetical protein